MDCPSYYYYTGISSSPDSNMRRMSEGCETHHFGRYYSQLIEFSKTTADKPDFQKSIDNINGWVNEQKEKKGEENIKKVGEALKTTVNALEKLKTGDPYDVTCGTLDIISSIALVAGGPFGVAFSALCSIAGAIVSANKPAKPSVVEQLAQVVHSELNNFFDKLQGAELSGLEGRVKRQKTSLQEMKEKEELDDENLWNDYDHFMGQLQYRVNLPLQAKFEQNLEQDPDMADFVRAVVTYCRAYTCFMALLTVARARFQEVGDSSDRIDTINRIIDHRQTNVKETLTFLSDKRYLKFIGRLPSEGGKLTKILLLTRNPTAKQVVESVRVSLRLPKMADWAEVKQAVEKVSRQRVKLKFNGETFALGLRGILAALDNVGIVIGSATTVLFINETDFPMRIVSGTVGWPKGNLEFVEDVKPHSYYSKVIWSFTGTFSTGGYIKIANKEKLSSAPANDDPSETDVRIIEFALSSPYAASVKINIQDKTDCGRTQGKDTYDKMTSDEGKTLYWKKGKVHHLARAEVLRTTPEQILDWVSFRKFNILPFTSKAKGTWCFIVQNFDPDKDLEEE